MADIKDVKVTISGVSMNGETYFKLLRLIKKHEPEIWDEIKDTVFDSLDSAAVKADASANGLHLQNVINWRFWNDPINNRIVGFVVGLILGVLIYACL